MSHSVRAPRGWLGACLTALITVFLASASNARAAATFYDSFESLPPGTSLNGTMPEIGADRYTIMGTGTAVAVLKDGDTRADITGLLFNDALMQFGPEMGTERWIRMDLPGTDAGIPVLIPQVLTGSETSSVGLPAIWPMDFDWEYLNTAFAAFVGGMSTPASLNLRALYPALNPEIPFRLEVHWKVLSPTTATMELRAWNGETPPAFAPGSSVSYVLAEGAWPASARSAITGVGARAQVSAIGANEPDPGTAHLVAATDAAISYSGRWTTVDGTERHAASAGQRFRFSVTGDRLYLRVRGTGNKASAPPLNIRVDNGAWTRVEPPSGGDHMVKVFDGDRGAGTHLVEALVSATWTGDPWSTTTSRFMLQGLSLAEGGTVSPAPYPSRKALFLGDSITSGHNILSQPLNAGPYGRHEARLAAPALVADLLGVDTINLSVPGIGFLRNVGQMSALSFFENELQGRPWTPSAQPDAVIINLGTNDDFGTDEELTAAVTAYLRAVRSKLPAARIFVLRPFNGTRAALLRASLEAVADPNSVWVDTTGWLDLAANRDTTDGVHPNTSGALKYAQRVADLLRAYFATFPTAEISLPEAATEVSGTVTVKGRATGYGFIGYRVEVARNDAPNVWTLLADGADPVYGGTLALWNAAGLPGGDYTLRLTVIANGRIAVDTASVTVPGLPGDLDGDNRLTLGDAVMALRISGGLTEASPQAAVRGDLVADGQVDILDAAAILRLATAAP